MVCSPPVVSKCLGEAHRRLELFTLINYLDYIKSFFPPYCWYFFCACAVPLRVGLARALRCKDDFVTPRAHARARGYVIGRGLYIHIYISTKKFQNFLNLSKYSLSEVHSNTGRLLFEFNRLLYILAAPEVFVVFANPVCLPSWYRVSIVRNTNIDDRNHTPTV